MKYCCRLNQEAFPTYSVKELLADYGPEQFGHRLHEGKSGGRRLYRCADCSSLVVEQRSLGVARSDGKILDYVGVWPVRTPLEARELNRNYTGDLSEHLRRGGCMKEMDTESGKIRLFRVKNQSDDDWDGTPSDRHYCAVYDGYVSVYDCGELYCGVDSGHLVKDGLLPLVSHGTMMDRAEYCKNCRYFGHSYEEMDAISEEEKQSAPLPHMCPICGKTAFPDMLSYDICPFCGWEDDALPDGESGANDLNVEEYRARYERLVAENPDYQWEWKHTGKTYPLYEDCEDD